MEEMEAKASQLLYEIPEKENIKQCQYKLFDKTDRTMCAQGILLYGCGWNSWLMVDDKLKRIHGAEYFRMDAVQLLIRESKRETIEDALVRWRKIQLMNDSRHKSFIEIADMLKAIDL